MDVKVHSIDPPLETMHSFPPQLRVFLAYNPPQELLSAKGRFVSTTGGGVKGNKSWAPLPQFGKSLKGNANSRAPQGTRSVLCGHPFTVCLFPLTSPACLPLFWLLFWRALLNTPHASKCQSQSLPPRALTLALASSLINYNLKLCTLEQEIGKSLHFLITLPSFY